MTHIKYIFQVTIFDGWGYSRKACSELYFHFDLLKKSK